MKIFKTYLTPNDIANQIKMSIIKEVTNINKTNTNQIQLCPYPNVININKPKESS